MSPGPRLRFVALLVLAQAGCLKDGPAPAGRRIFAGQTVESPSFVDERTIRFQVRVAAGTETKGGVNDLWLTSLDGQEQRRFLADVSDRWSEQAHYWWKDDYPSWQPGPGESWYVGERYFMTNEHFVARNGARTYVATLVRLDHDLVEQMRIEGVATYSRFTVPIDVLYPGRENKGRSCPGFAGLENNCPQLYYERAVAEGELYPTFMLWDGTNHIPVGPDSGSFQHQILGSSTYLILGDNQTLTRFNRPANTLESLRGHVSRFQVSWDQRYAVLVVTDEGRTKTTVRELGTGREIDPAKPPSPWGGIDGDVLTYYVGATASTQAEIRFLNLKTGEDRFVTLPSPLANWGGEIPRPNSDERLLTDSQGRGVFTGRDDLVARRVVQGPLIHPSFSPDGAYLAYIQLALPSPRDPTPQGALMFQDAELQYPPVQVSPSGLLITTRYKAYGFLEADDVSKPILYFWSHVGRASSDLHFADYDDGLPTNLRLVARSILTVSISKHNLFGILNVSQQDGVGDLVYRDLDKQQDILYAQSVAFATELPGKDLASSYTAYVIRAREESDRSGLWVSPMAPPLDADGGAP